MKEGYQSNYEKVLEMDQEALIKKFHLEADGENLYLVYFSKKLKISRVTGKISYVEEPERKPGFDTSITIYNMFHYACETPVESGKLVPFREVKRVYPFEAAYKRTILKRFSETFSGHVKELSKACEALGGTRLPRGMQDTCFLFFRFFILQCFSGTGTRNLTHREICFLIRILQISFMRKM